MTTAIHGKNTRLLGRGYDLSPFFKKVSIQGTRNTHDDTTLGDADREFKGGRIDGELSADGLYSDAANEIQPILETIFGTNTAADVYMVLPNGHTIGYPFMGLKGINTEHKIGGPDDDLVDVSISVPSRTGMDIGKLLHDFTAKTSTYNGTSIDNSASTANGGAGLIVVTAFTGTNCTLKIQHSTDDSVWADLITFTVATGITAERVEVARGTTVNRYLRAAITAGTFSSITFQTGFARYAA